MAWLEFARKRPILASKGNFRKGGMKRPYQGLVLHIEEGTEEGTFGWFNLSKAKRQAQFDAAGLNLTAYASSAHFGNPKRGTLDQFIDTDDQAFAQGPGNDSWLSCENEGMLGDALTTNQIHTLARLMAYLAEKEDVPLSIANSPSESGLGYHSMSTSWGHPQCPGDAVIKQRPAVLAMAMAMLGGREPDDSIPDWMLGWWSVNDTNQYYYYFYEGGEVVHTKTKPATSSAKPKNIGNHGTATVTEHGVDIQWRPFPKSTPTTEKFTHMGWTSTTKCSARRTNTAVSRHAKSYDGKLQLA
jgi:hypothetical protein